jgi:hypothetical protein
MLLRFPAWIWLQERFNILWLMENRRVIFYASSREQVVRSEKAAMRILTAKAVRAGKFGSVRRAAYLLA